MAIDQKNIKGDLVDWIKSYKPEYFITLMLAPNVKAAKSVIERAQKLGKNALNYLVGRHKSDSGTANFSFVPVCESCEDGKLHLHILLGGGFKAGIGMEETKVFFRDYWSSLTGTMHPKYHDSTDHKWFQRIKDIDAVVSYALKGVNLKDPYNNKTLLLDAVKLRSTK